jgi:poly(3-hydroxyalkanoate) synthetase
MYFVFCGNAGMFAMPVLQLIDEDCIIAQKKVVAQNFLTRYHAGSINQLEYRMESIRISINRHNALLVDVHEDNGAWLHMYVENGSMYVTLTNEQAQELIAALQEVIA